MRKRIIGTAGNEAAEAGAEWLDLDEIAEVEITSEDPDHPIESALLPGRGDGWRAAGPGEQTVRLLFPEPVHLGRIAVEFSEPARERTQEFVLRWSPDAGATFREVVRQQWNFSPTGSTDEAEEFSVDLAGVTVLELTIRPDIGGGDAPASLRRLRVAGV